MRICFIASQLNHGGASIVAVDVAKGMAAKGHDVLFLTTGKNDELYIKDQITFDIIGQKRKIVLYHLINPYILIKTYKKLKEFRPDIIHFHNINLKTFSLCSLLFSWKYPAVWTIHDLWPFYTKGWPDIPLNKFSLTSSTFFSDKIIIGLKNFIYKIIPISIIYPSKWIKTFSSQSELSKKHSIVIYNGVPRPDFEDVSINLPIEKDKKKILFIGGKSLGGLETFERKGWKYLKQAIIQLSKQRNDFKLIYVGDYPDINENKSLPIIYLKYLPREKMSQIFRQSDIFILPTLGDNFPLTILEAMSNKIPIIASKIAGNVEAIDDNVTGLLCEPENISNIMNKIEQLLDYPQKIKKLKLKAYTKYKKTFTLEIMVERNYFFYKEIIRNRIIN